MNKPTPPLSLPIDDESLVAYLDGELSREDNHNFEQRLLSDVDLQQRLSELQASWDLLSELPSPTPRHDLTQTTIEMVTLDLQTSDQTWLAWLSQRRWLMLALAAVTMLLAGVASSRARTSYTTRQILANLPSVVDLPALKNVDSIEFLHALSKIDNLTTAADNQSERGRIGDGLVPQTIADRRDWVERLEEDSRGRLVSNLAEYDVLTEQQKRVMRTVADEIYADPSASGNLLRVIHAYNAILERWGTKPRAMLQDMSLQNRIEAIRDRVAVLMALNYVPTPQDRLVLRQWLESIIQNQDSSDQLFYYNYDAQKIVDELLWGDVDNSIVTQEDIQELLQHGLAPQVAQRLSDIGDEPARRYHLGLWLAPLLAGNPERANNGNIDLMQRFSKLDARRQNALEFLPEEEARKQLRQPLLNAAQASPP